MNSIWDRHLKKHVITTPGLAPPGIRERRVLDRAVSSLARLRRNRPPDLGTRPLTRPQARRVQKPPSYGGIRLVSALLTYMVPRNRYLCQMFSRLSPPSLSLMVDAHVVCGEAAKENGKVVLAWLHARCRKWCERHIPSEECAL